MHYRLAFLKHPHAGGEDFLPSRKHHHAGGEGFNSMGSVDPACRRRSHGARFVRITPNEETPPRGWGRPNCLPDDE
jgi:hypothetical protein